MITPETLRAAADQRRTALDCDSDTARRFDAAAQALEEAHEDARRLRAELAAARARGALLSGCLRLLKQRTQERDEARQPRIIRCHCCGVTIAASACGHSRAIAAALAWQRAVRGMDGWEEAERDLHAALDELRGETG
jgi:hypothetical protein